MVYRHIFSQFVNWTVLPADPESISLALQDPVQEIIRIGKKKKCNLRFVKTMVLILGGNRGARSEKSLLKAFG